MANPLIAQITIGDRHIGTMSMLGVKMLKNGSIRYEVCYKAEGKEWKAKVSHNRAEGALRLIQKASGIISKKIRQFYSVPKECIRYLSGPEECPTFWNEQDENGEETGKMRGVWVGVKESDIPERYRKEMNEVLGAGTCGILEGESFIYLHDIQGFLDKAIAGIKPMFD